MAKKTLSKPLKTIYLFSSSTKDEVPHDSNVVLVNLAVFQSDGAVHLHNPSEQLKTWISGWQASGKRVLVSLGGDASPPQDWHHFYGEKSPEAFKALTENLSKLQINYGFDGFDLDVEGQSVLTLDDAKQFAELGTRLRNKFPDAIIALTVPANNALISGTFWADFIGGLEPPHNRGWNVMAVIAHDKAEFDRVYDFVQIMAYDSPSDVRDKHHQGSAAWLAHVYRDFAQPCTYKFNTGIKQAGAEAYNNYPGIATSKLVLGVTADAANPGYAAPTEIAKVQAELKTLAEDRDASLPALDLQLGGGMVWQAGSDKANRDHAVSTALYALLK